MVIAIDGPAGAGKSTVAERVAERLGFLYLNSGNFYRAVSLSAIESGVELEDPEQVLRVARALDLRVEQGRYLIAGRDRGDDLHTDAVDRWVARHSAIVAVRHEIVRRLREISHARNLVMEGRDITTVVFPDAEYKFYLDASVEARSRRRLLQGTSRLEISDIRKNIEERDAIDRNKAEGSLIVAANALYIDTSDLTLDEVCEKVIANIRVPTTTRSFMEVMAEKEQKAPEASPGPTPRTQDELQEQYLRTLDDLEEGQLVQGIVVETTADSVFVDVGYKSEGKIPLAEFRTTPKIGDSVQVVLLKKENRAGEVIVSKQKADEKLFWKNLRIAFQEKQPIEGRVTKTVKGGYEVFLGHEISAFNPISKMDIHRVQDPEVFVGLESKFYIERLYSDNRVNIVLSRKTWLEEDIAARKKEFFEKTQIGDVVEGTVKSFTSFGAFVDLGGFDGLLHINDMSWGHVVRPKDFVRKGEKISLKVIKLDPIEQKINLSLKHFKADPWTTFETKYRVDDVVRGTVTKLADFGAFIELEEGIEGLAHISEFSWVRRIHHPKEMLQPGDSVDVKILGYDLSQGKLSLGIKQVSSNPWDEISEKYPVGMRLTRVVKKLTSAGAFVELEEGIDGFLHSDELSWTKKIKNPGSVLKEGEEVEVMVIESDRDNRNIRLSVKQLSEDPWVSLKKAFPERSVIDGEVTNVTDFGVFVRVQGGVEGLISKMNLADRPAEEIENVLKSFKPGDHIRAMVMEISPARQKLSLSIRDYLRKQQREDMRKYIHDEGDQGTVTLGDFLSKDRENQ